jgi:hypothetical protein
MYFFVKQNDDEDIINSLLKEKHILISNSDVTHRQHRHSNKNKQPTIEGPRKKDYKHACVEEQQW